MAKRIGNNKDNKLKGTDQDDLLKGKGGNDLLEGGDGFDQFIGGEGKDTLDGGSDDFGDVVFYEQEGGDRGIKVNLKTGKATDTYGDKDKLIDINEVFGTKYKDTITGTDGNFFYDNGIRGLAGKDVLKGGGGFDILYYDSDFDFGGKSGVKVDFAKGKATDGFGDKDKISEFEGVRGTRKADKLFGDDDPDSISYFQGMKGKDVIEGRGGFNILDYTKDEEGGGNGAITANLATGLVVDGFGDTDKVSGINLVRGTRFDDNITGDSRGTEFQGLAGNDTLDGGAGLDLIDFNFDSAQGGNSGVTVDLASGTATDGFGDTDSFSNFENVRGTGNSDTLSGNAGANLFQGMGGNDTFDGRGGSDTADYSADEIFGGAAGVVVNLAAGSATDAFGGTDTLINIENARGTSRADTLIGGAGGSKLEGLVGEDRLTGGALSDVLDGGEDADRMIFDKALAANNIDTVVAFAVGEDTVVLDSSIFAGLAIGVLNAAAFKIAAAATEADDRIIYNSVSGNLSYDADGLNGASGVLFAKLGANLALTNQDFEVVA